MPPLSWNRYPVLHPDSVEPVHSRSRPFPEQDGLPYITFGNGRSYSDVCLSSRGTVLLSRWLDRFISFDRESGVLRCESGVTLEEVLRLVMPHGWFLACTPGTRFVTVGGAVANDVHGKNHHVNGSFGDCVQAIGLVRTDQGPVECRPGSDLFRATIGGLGLTGFISWVEIQLMPVQGPWMWSTGERFSHIDEYWAVSQAAEESWPYTVAWIDCLAPRGEAGRGILFSAMHDQHKAWAAPSRGKALKMPLDPPFSLVNSLSIRLFNSLYFRQKLAPGGESVYFQRYFYPLDNIRGWNRIYGRKGFLQYQCVIPPSNAKAATAELISQIRKHGQGSFLAVLKTFGDRRGRGILSFPRPGTTLALDFPNKGKRTLELFRVLDDIVRSAGGGLYPAKDARMPGHMFRESFPEWEQFARYTDPAFSSAFWERVTS